jgi:uncharacterized protein DUF1647
VVTAASSNHAGALRYLLESLRRLGARVDCYDLGLTPRERASLPLWPRLTLHRFNYAAYPAYLDVAVNAGEYAWKPVIVAEVVEQLRAEGLREHVLWCDAGTYFDALDPIDTLIGASRGVWVRRSSGTMREWTHAGMFRYFNADVQHYGARPNADATLIGFATGHAEEAVRQRVYDELVVPWRSCALARDCIAPPGSSRRNHRQDQAVLSYLVHRAGFPLAADSSGRLRVRCKCDRWFYRYIGFHVPPPVYARGCLY